MKKIPIIPLLGLLVPVLVAPAAFADVAADLRQAEGLYEAGQYTQAEQAYLTVVREADPNKPADVEAAFNARKKLASVYIATDRLPQAKEAVRQLLSRYAQYEFLPHAIHEIAEGAKPLLKLPQVRQLYQDMVTAQPGDAQAIWLKMGIAVASAYLAEDQAVDATLQNIIGQHGADDRAAEALNHIAWAYRKLQRYNEALTIYQYVVNNWPQKDRVVFAQQGIAICQLQLGDRQAADATLAVMLQKFGKDENISKLLAWAVYGYVQAGETEGAYKVFDLVMQTYPEAPETLDALLTLATAAIQGEDRARIEPTIQTLLTRFAPTEAKARGLDNVAGQLFWKCMQYMGQQSDEQDLPGVCNRCLGAIANYTLANWPQSDWAVRAERDLAVVALRSGDDAAAETAVNWVTTNYPNHENTPAALLLVANRYIRGGKAEKARAVYQYLLENYPSADVIPLAKAGLAEVQVRQGDDKAGEAGLQKIMTDYAGDARLPQALDMVAEGYLLRGAAGVSAARSAQLSDQAKADHLKAIAKWQYIIDHLPTDPYVTGVAHYSAAAAYFRLGDYTGAIDKCTQLLQQQPDHQDAWRAQSLLVKVYKQQMRQAGKTTSEEQILLRQTLEQLLQRYPTCPVASSARRSLEAISDGNEGGHK